MAALPNQDITLIQKGSGQQAGGGAGMLYSQMEGQQFKAKARVLGEQGGWGHLGARARSCLGQAASSSECYQLIVDQSTFQWVLYAIPEVSESSCWTLGHQCLQNQTLPLPLDTTSCP